MPLYKTWDRFGQIDFLRPASGFDAEPGGAVSRMINISAAGVPIGEGFLVLLADGGDGSDPIVNHVQIWNGGWTLKLAGVQPDMTPQSQGTRSDLVNLLWFTNGHLVGVQYNNRDNFDGVWHAGPDDSSFAVTNLVADGTPPAGFSNGRNVCGLDFSPTTGRMFAARAAAYSPNSGQATLPFEIFRSDDYGETWTLHYTVPAWGGGNNRNYAQANGVGMFKAANQLAVDPNNPNVIAFACRQAGQTITSNTTDELVIVYSLDAGETWTVGAPVTFNDGDAEFQFEDAWSGSRLFFGNSGRLFWYHADSATGNPDFLVYSDDLGGSWTRPVLDVGFAPKFAAYKPAMFNELLFVDYLTFRIKRSTDNGATWATILSSAEYTNIDARGGGCDFDPVARILYTQGWRVIDNEPEADEVVFEPRAWNLNTIPPTHEALVTGYDYGFVPAGTDSSVIALKRQIV